MNARIITIVVCFGLRLYDQVSRLGDHLGSGRSGRSGLGSPHSVNRSVAGHRQRVIAEKFRLRLQVFETILIFCRRGRQAIRPHVAQHVGEHVRVAVDEYLARGARRVVFGGTCDLRRIVTRPRALSATHLRASVAQQRFEVARARQLQRRRGGLKHAAAGVYQDARVFGHFAVSLVAGASRAPAIRTRAARVTVQSVQAQCT
mmetsp:Transcript_2539/g.7711  ORF Transcript_2539/g.7711 Transcript_2539/m.7711 type:complete len:203 (+) Transcript_2539:363-971(+)